ncbi:MAG: type II toxin-antitoxin system VapC family toxin [Chloroflexi bacterium]|nr:type II toxin-antitoxin system VapC family toxin [Chloroflexota bacterium]
MKLFVDTSGWVSLFDRSDKYHAITAEKWQILKQEPTDLLTSDYVLDETLTFLLYKAGRRQALQFGRWVLSRSFIKVTHIDHDVWQSAWQMFQNRDDKEWAFTDCTSFVLMQQHSLWTAFTFDHHFEQAGFKLWPQA